VRAPRWPAAVVFDFDGLLMDTETSLLASWRYEWAQWGLTLDEATFFADHGGNTSHEKYAQLAAAVGSSYDRALSHERRLAFRAELHAALDLAEGIREWIAEAVSAGITLGVASSSSRAWVEGHLRRVAVLEHFTVLACGDEVEDAKPAPDVYHLALDRLDVRAAEAVAVEDTPHGVAAAQAAGLSVIAIPNPFVEPCRLGMAELVLESAHGVCLTNALRVVGALIEGSDNG
jgi:HAD superfamily hydrolase (TIGR01509 family)